MIYQLHRPTVTTRPGRLMIAAMVIILSLPMASIGLALADSSQLPDSSLVGPLLINEVKSGGTNTQPLQYVTLYNGGNQAISLEGWRVEYAKQAFPAQYCATANWDDNAPSMVNVATSQIVVQPLGVSQTIEIPINDNDPGAIHIVDAQGVVHDTVGWGKDALAAPCYEAAQTAQLTASKALQRYLGCQSGRPIDSDHNASDFFVADDPTPAQTSGRISPQCAPSDPEPVPDDPGGPDDTVTPPPPPDTSGPGCPGVIVSEILPNPAGSDVGHEYIELHNPTAQAIDLQDCDLQTSASTSVSFALNARVLEAGAYLVLGDTETNLTLPNASGGTVWLSSLTEELQAISYPADMDDDVSWSLLGSQWSASYSLTPGAANIGTPAKPCEVGLIRNPETNRCINPPTTDSPEAAPSTSSPTVVACKSGQVRNPATNRCRAVTSASSAVTTATACKAGQERNPETNRCRNLTTAAAATKACPQGQERNPDTNRCRKISAAAASAGAKVTDTDTPASGSSGMRTWLIAGLAIALLVGYGIYEWRQEIILWFKRRFGKLPAYSALSRV